MKTSHIPGRPALAVDHAGAGELLVLMHGIGGNRTNWTDQVATFSPHFQTVAWDARGYGLSEDYDGPLDFADFSRDLLRLLDHFGACRAHLCGLSMGGADRPGLLPFISRAGSLRWSSSPPSPASSGWTRPNAGASSALRLHPLTEGGKQPRDIAPTVAATLIGPEADRRHFDRLVESMGVLHKESYIKTLQATTTYEEALELETVTVPTLLIFGENDSLTPPAVGRGMAARIAGSRFVEVPRSGHLINIEEAEIFNARVPGIPARARVRRIWAIAGARAHAGFEIPEPGGCRRSGARELWGAAWAKRSTRVRRCQIGSPRRCHGRDAGLPWQEAEPSQRGRARSRARQD